MVRSKYFKYLLFFLPLTINSQALDSLAGGGLNESFINSLPENIRADFIDSQNPDQPNVTTVDPQTRISKLEFGLKDAERMIDSLRSELNAGVLRRDNKDIVRFGDNFFSSYQSTFLPVNEPNFDGNYILDVGDELTIQLIGQTKFIKKFKINRDGSIDLPEVGKIYLASKSLQEAEVIIQKMVEDSFFGVTSTVSLTDLRDMNILMVGNVIQPGMYILQGGASIIQAIFNAGGISDLGSYRSILHKRNNEVINQIDLYQVVAFGNFAFSSSLRSGDSLVVQSKGAEVVLFSESLNDAIYEVLPGESLADILEFAGFNPTRFDSNFPFNLTRAENQNRVTKQIDYAQAGNFMPQHGDTFQMNSIDPYFSDQIKVRISGEVSIPGTYVVEKGTKLSDIITLAGGYSDKAYPLGGIFLRDSVKQLEMQMRDRAYYDLINFVSASPTFAASTSPEGLLSFLSVLKDYQPLGRLSTDFNVNSLVANPDKDFYLEDKDEIIIPIFKPQVFVFGEIMNPGAVNHVDGKPVDYYLSKSGGFSRLADSKRVVVIQPNGETFLATNSLFGIFKGEGYLQPGSTIYIPKQIGKVDGINLAATVSPIVSSFALSLASLNSIND